MWLSGYDSSAPAGLNAADKGVKARVFQGGNHWDLHKMLEVKSGSEVSWVQDSNSLEVGTYAAWHICLQQPKRLLQLREWSTNIKF